VLNQANLRITRQRMVILEELRNVDTHPSANEVYAMVRKRLPRVSLGTIYRNLEILSKSGEIRRIDSGGGLKRFDGKADDHYHIRCLRCDRLVDAFIELGLDIDKQLKGTTDFLVFGHRLEFVGLCPHCRPQPAEPSRLPNVDKPKPAP
jgi:Fur family transcriptional regulator, ferric uptake regulator